MEPFDAWLLAEYLGSEHTDLQRMLWKQLAWLYLVDGTCIAILFVRRLRSFVSRDKHLAKHPYTLFSSLSPRSHTGYVEGP